MLLNKPNPKSTIQVVVRDRDANQSKSRTFYDTTIEDVFRILESAATGKPVTDQRGQHIDVSA